MRSTVILSGLMLSFLTACTTPLPTTVYRIEKLRVPESLLQPCPVPGLQGNRNRDLANAYRLRGDSLEACNADKDAIRRWNNEP